MNNAYPTNRMGYRFLTPDGKMLKSLVREICEAQDLRRDPPVCVYRSVTIILWYPHTRGRGKGQSMFYMNGNLKRLDLTNMAKLIEDAFNEYIGQDDSSNLSVNLHKRVAPDDRMLITILASESNLDAPIYHDGELIAHQ